MDEAFIQMAIVPAQQQRWDPHVLFRRRPLRAKWTEVIRGAGLHTGLNHRVEANGEAINFPVPLLDEVCRNCVCVGCFACVQQLTCGGKHYRWETLFSGGGGVGPAEFGHDSLGFLPNPLS